MSPKIVQQLLVAIIAQLLFCFICNSSTAQTVPPALAQSLVGKTKLKDIMTEVDKYYRPLYQPKSKNAEGEEEGEYSQWVRWAWFAGLHTNELGEVDDYSKRTLEAYKATNTKFGLKAYTNGLQSPQAANPVWYNIGPDYTVYGTQNKNGRGLGRVDRIAFAPGSSTTIYAGTPAGGLFKTTNGGSSWAPLSEYLPSLGVSGIVVSYNNSNTIYVLTGDGDSWFVGGFVKQFGYIRYSQGVFKSTDGGNTWQETGNLFTGGNYVGFNLAQSTTDANTLLAATDKGIYRTTNGGTSWTLVRAGAVTDVKFKPGDGTRAYACGSGFVTYSTDGGATWTGAPTYDVALTGGGNGRLSVTAANSSYVYYFNGVYVNSTHHGGVYLSTNSGASFVQKSNSPLIISDAASGSAGNTFPTYCLGITASPLNAAKVMTCSPLVWGSTNSGGTMGVKVKYFENDGGTFEADKYTHPDVHTIVYAPDGSVWVGSDGGVWKSTDDGTTWADKATFIDAAQVYHMDNFAGDDYWVLAGMQDNGINHKVNSLNSFTHIAGGDGFDADVFNTDKNQALVSINTDTYRFSSLSGYTNVYTTPPAKQGNSYEWYPKVLAHNSVPDTIFNGFSDIYRSVNGGSTWTNTGAAGNWAMIGCPSNNRRFYAAGGADFYTPPGALYRSDDGGVTWITKSGNANFPASGSRGRITNIAVLPSSSFVVAASLGGYNAGNKVVYSTDGGDNWTNISGTLPNVPVYSVAFDDNSNIYCGTDIGVFVRPSGANDWLPFYNGLPPVPVTELRVNNVDNTLKAATFGRGIWKTSQYTTCDADISVNYNLEGPNFFEASNTITASGASAGVANTANTQVFFKSGNSVTLSPSFIAREGSEFKAYIAGCNSYGVPTFAANTEIPQHMLINQPSMATLDAGQDGNSLNATIRTYTGGNYVLALWQGGKIIQQLQAWTLTNKRIINKSYALDSIKKTSDTRLVLWKDGIIVAVQEF